MLSNSKNEAVMGQRVGSKYFSRELKNMICDLSKASQTPTYIVHFYKLSKNTVKQ